MPDAALYEDAPHASTDEALEDAALAEAVRAGRETPFVSREEVFSALRGCPA